MNIFRSRFFVVYLITFINVLSFTLLIPVFPFLIKVYSQPEVMLWIFAASFSLFQFLWAPIMWYLSDKYWRRPVLIVTQFWTLLSWFLLWIASFLPEINLFGIIILPIFVILLSRMTDWITWWNQSVLNAMIWDLTTKEERTQIFWVNGAVVWIWLIIWPSIWAFSMSTKIGYLWTAIIGAFFSLIAFFILVFLLKESLREENKNKKLKFSFKQLNIFSQIKKYWNWKDFKFALTFKIFFNASFMVYTTISVLYLIDVFNFSEITVWFYLIITGLFFIFHQLVSIKFFTNKFWDVKSALYWFISLSLWYLGMWFSDNIYLYTFFYFFSILWVALSFTTLKSIFSKGATEKQQWEVMWIFTWIESFLAIIFPIVWAYIYQISDISIFKIISIFPFIALIIYFIFFRKVKS
jgi:DHA1 family tetracycline resistance protein-like MFS transporter